MLVKHKKLFSLLVCSLLSNFVNSQTLQFLSKEVKISSLESNDAVIKQLKTKFKFNIDQKEIEIQFYKDDVVYATENYNYYTVEEKANGTYTFTILNAGEPIIISINGKNQSINMVEKKYYIFKILPKERSNEW